jgi:hypothetical protein
MISNHTRGSIVQEKKSDKEEHEMVVVLWPEWKPGEMIGGEVQCQTKWMTVLLMTTIGAVKVPRGEWTNNTLVQNSKLSINMVLGRCTPAAKNNHEDDVDDNSSREQKEGENEGSEE